ncbi:hypothetical protein Pmani_027971 [Petrolisthes manimaculis]|uniref:Uncharacterized protein n=1 Tax=Petrolisthes manimaculis TaxID=1843537 RepID=A0AAE1P2F4_9EUCA|nr:hypothetical protein Pmani_027971 [Petrolisthes manimaculis]
MGREGAGGVYTLTEASLEQIPSSKNHSKSRAGVERSRMRDNQRSSSARSTGGGSRRRRWEMKSKESFETSVAVEYNNPSPQHTSGPSHYSCRKEQTPRNDQHRTPKTPKNDQHHTPKNNQYHTPRRDPNVERRNVFNGTSRKDYAQVVPPQADHGGPAGGEAAEETDSDPDLLAAKLSAIIEEANVKTKNGHRSQKGKPEESVVSQKENVNKDNVQFVQDDVPNEKLGRYPMEIVVHKDKDKAQYINDKFETKSLKMALSPPAKTEEESEYQASAPPMSPPETEESTAGRKKKHRKKSEQKVVVLGKPGEESYISLQLREMEEDVRDTQHKATAELCTLSAPSLLLSASVSQPSTAHAISTIFREEIGGFVVARHGFEGLQKKNEDLYDPSQIPTRTSHAIFLQNGFRTFSVLCQGLLAGITLAHCLVIFLLDSKPSAISGVYTPVMAHVFFALVMFLTTLCLVASCDRHDLLGLGVFSGHGIKIPWTPAFYIASLVLSLVAVRTENILINVQMYQEEKVFTHEEVTEYVDWWRWVCVARTCLVVLAWLAVVPDPHTDSLLHALDHINKNNNNNSSNNDNK